MFHDAPEMLFVLDCESSLTHYKEDGTVLRGRVTPDVGVSQISLEYNGKQAEALGYDVEDIYDNFAFARVIFEEQGINAWTCHNKVAMH